MTRAEMERINRNIDICYRRRCGESVGSLVARYGCHRNEIHRIIANGMSSTQIKAGVEARIKAVEEMSTRKVIKHK